MRKEAKERTFDHRFTILEGAGSTLDMSLSIRVKEYRNLWGVGEMRDRNIGGAGYSTVSGLRKKSACKLQSSESKPNISFRFF
jgi:hypothetical protein